MYSIYDNQYSLKASLLSKEWLFSLGKAEMVAIAVLRLVAVLAGGNRLNHTGPVDSTKNSAAEINLGGGSDAEDSEDDEEDKLVHDLNLERFIAKFIIIF